MKMKGGKMQRRREYMGDLGEEEKKEKKKKLTFAEKE